MLIHLVSCLILNICTKGNIQHNGTYHHLKSPHTCTQWFHCIKSLCTCKWWCHGIVVYTYVMMSWYWKYSFLTFSNRHLHCLPWIWQHHLYLQWELLPTVTPALQIGTTHPLNFTPCTHHF
jgi:hypothetical protein